MDSDPTQCNKLSISRFLFQPPSQREKKREKNRTKFRPGASAQIKTGQSLLNLFDTFAVSHSLTQSQEYFFSDIYLSIAQKILKTQNICLDLYV